MEDCQEMRVLALDERNLLGRTLGDSQEVAAGQVGTQEGSDPQGVVFALADLH